jgi:hypothetical protein
MQMCEHHRCLQIFDADITPLLDGALRVLQASS